MEKDSQKKNVPSKMMQHYLSVKEKYKDCILFYRLGDFYEMFFDDAVKVSDMLELTLTGKDCGLIERAPMCGIPYHAADNYIAKLVSRGEKVAICEQLSEPNGKGLVERDVVKIITAGTFTNNEILDDKSNNFIASVYLNKLNGAVSWADITTGEFTVHEFSGNNIFSSIIDILVRINPSEIISNEAAATVFNSSSIVKHGALPHFIELLDSDYNLSNATELIKKQFGVLNLDYLSLSGKDSAIKSVGGMISYLGQTQMKYLPNITKVKIEKSEEYLMLDVNAIKNLELTETIKDNKKYGSLLWLLDKTKTSMGARKLKNWILTPLRDINQINYRLDAVEAFYNNTPIRESLIDILGAIKDIGRISGKISDDTVTPKDCYSILTTLKCIPSIKFSLSGVTSSAVKNICDNMFELPEIVKLLDATLDDNAPVSYKEGGFIKKGFDSELDRLNDLKTSGTGYIKDLERKEKERTGIKNLKIAYNRIFGYYIEVPNSAKENVPYDYIRRQTVMNAERYVTEELKKLENELYSSTEESLNLELKIYKEIRKSVYDKLDYIIKTAEAISELDVILALSKVSKENDYCKPKLMPAGSDLNIKDGRHPVVEQINKKNFIPNDTYLNQSDSKMMIITGPNMAGKSTYMRQTALIALMAHIGSFVPAKSAEIPIFDRIFTRVGASDNLISDQSTIMVEMSEMATILENATKDSLIILDEIGRGTSTYDGLSIAWAVVEFLCEKIGAKTMFATHYHELTELENLLSGVKNYKVTVKEFNGSIIFLRKILRGGTNKSFGIEVAELAGIDKEVILRAKTILKNLEKSDIVKFKSGQINSVEDKKEESEIEEYIKHLDLDTVSPIEALKILIKLQGKTAK